MGEERIEARKSELRRLLRRLRKEIPEEDRRRADAAIAGRLSALPEFAACDVLLPYLSFGAEVETRGVIRAAWEAGKVVALPWCVPGTRRMRWYRVTDLDDLVRSSFGVDQPVPDPANEQDPKASARALAVVPGLTFDRNGHRLGYGGGFYDAFLSSFRGVAVGLCRERQLSEDLRSQGVIDAHDLPVGIVVTEERVLRIRP